MVHPFSDDPEEKRRHPAEPVNSAYLPPASHPDVPNRSFSPRDHSISAEPWFKTAKFVAEPAHASDLEGVHSIVQLEDLAENSVWDEHSTSPRLSGEPNESAVTWYRYYQSKVAETPGSLSWLATLGIIVLAGPLAVVGTLLSGGDHGGLIMIVVMGPTVEEILKVALPLWVIEKRPWLFSSGTQILCCAVGAGLIFSALENMLYLNVYVPNPSNRLVLWRWTACVLLHTGCSFIAAVGIIRIRQKFLARTSRPQLVDGSRWITAAIVIHGLYNFTAILANDWFT